MVLAACLEYFAQFIDGHAAIPEGEVVNIALQVVAVGGGTILPDIPCHSAVEICVFDAAIDNPVELSIRLALAEAGYAFGRDCDGVEDPFIGRDVIDSHVRAMCVMPTAEIEMDAWICGIVDVACAADDEARPCAIPPVLVAEDGRIADMRRRKANPHGSGEVVAILQLKILCVLQHDAFSDIFAAWNPQAFVEFSAIHARFDILSDNGDFKAIGGDIDRRLRIKRQIGEKAFRQRTTLDFGDFRADDMAVQIQRREIDSEMGQRRDRHVVIAWNTGQNALRYVLADHEDWNRIGVAAEHAVAFAVATMIAGDENQPVLFGERRSRGDGVEQLADDDVGLDGGVDVFLAVRIEAIRMAAVIDFTDEEQRGVRTAVGGGVETGEIVAVFWILPFAEWYVWMFGGVFVFAP